MKKRVYLSILTAFMALFSTLTLNGCKENIPEQKNLYNYTPKDSIILQQKVDQFSSFASLPINELTIKIALSFLETPYVAGTLEGDKELFTINLRETDCILFVEMCTAIALTIKEVNISSDNTRKYSDFERYCSNLRAMRYINGYIGDYSTRNHYTSGWIIQNEKYGIMSEISSYLSSVKLPQKFFFMSENPGSYKQLKNSPDLVDKIRSVEQGLNKYEYFHIAKADIESVKDNIKNGDIVCFTSKVPGLDIAHVALAYWHNGDLHFIHASSKAMKVIIEEKTLSDYTSYGIRLIRFK